MAEKPDSPQAASVNSDDDDCLPKEDDLYLSDVHIENRPVDADVAEEDRNGTNKSLIEFHLKNQPSAVEAASNSEVTYDDDGDLCIRRPEKYNLIIEHHLQTDLSNVGLQVWKGSLYLCDFILDNCDLFKDKIVVDLGSGVGLTSFITSLYASKVYCTDYLESILQLAHKNFEINREILENLVKKLADLKFKLLNWTDYESLFDDSCKSAATLFDLEQSDYETLKEASVFIAADVVYDDELTISFLNVLFKLMAVDVNQPKYAYISIEKRVNFEFERFDECSSCYDYFENSMIELNSYSDGNIKFETELIEYPIPQYMSNYNRNEYLRLWRVKTSHIDD